jgi:hypothetical protein
MEEINEEWFESRVPGTKGITRVSRFLRNDFSVSRRLLEEKWHLWTNEERLRFAGAFSARGELRHDDQGLLDFLMENGTPQIWMTIALLVSKHKDKDYALKFLLERVKEGVAPLANYYQALEMLVDSRSASALEEALSRHRADVDSHPNPRSKTERFIYWDYLYCSAALFRITGREEYRATIRKMLQHPDETVRKMVPLVASSNGIAIG